MADNGYSRSYGATTDAVNPERQDLRPPPPDLRTTPLPEPVQAVGNLLYDELIHPVAAASRKIEEYGSDALKELLQPTMETMVRNPVLGSALDGAARTARDLVWPLLAPGPEVFITIPAATAALDAAKAARKFPGPGWGSPGGESGGGANVGKQTQRLTPGDLPGPGRAHPVRPQLPGGPGGEYAAGVAESSEGFAARQPRLFDAGESTTGRVPGGRGKGGQDPVDRLPQVIDERPRDIDGTIDAEHASVRGTGTLDMPTMSDDIGKYFDEGDGIKTRGVSINLDPTRTTSKDVVGAQARSIEDIADLGRLFRDPQKETLRVLYVKDGRVVHHEGLTSHMPSMAPAGNPAKPGSHRQWFADVDNRRAELEADGYYLVHNHPTGVPEASDADINITEDMAAEVPGFLGHVIYDHDKYAALTPTSGHIARRDHLDKTGQLSLNLHHAPDLNHDLFGDPQKGIPARRLHNQTAAIASRDFVDPPEGHWTVVHTDAKRYARAVQDWPVERLFAADSPDRLGNFGQRFGSNGAVAYSPKTMAELSEMEDMRASALILNGVLDDVITADGVSFSLERGFTPVPNFYGQTAMSRAVEGFREVGEAATDYSQADLATFDNVEAAEELFVKQLPRRQAVSTAIKELEQFGVPDTPAARKAMEDLRAAYSVKNGELILAGDKAKKKRATALRNLRAEIQRVAHTERFGEHLVTELDDHRLPAPLRGGKEKWSKYYDQDTLSLKPAGEKAGMPALLDADGNLDLEAWRPMYEANLPTARAVNVARSLSREAAVVGPKHTGGDWSHVDMDRIQELVTATEDQIRLAPLNDKAFPRKTKKVRAVIGGQEYNGVGGANGAMEFDRELREKTGRGIMSHIYDDVFRKIPNHHRVAAFMADPEIVLKRRGIDPEQYLRMVLAGTNEGKYWYEHFGYLLRSIGFSDEEALQAFISQGPGSQKASPMTQLVRFFSWWSSFRRNENWHQKDPTSRGYAPGQDASGAPLRNARWGTDLGSPKTDSYWRNMVYAGLAGENYPSLRHIDQRSPATIDTWIFRLLSDDDDHIKMMHGNRDFYDAASDWTTGLAEALNQFFPDLGDQVNNHQLQSLLWHPIRELIEPNTEPTFIEFFDAAGKFAKQRWGSDAVNRVKLGGTNVLVPKAEILKHPDWEIFAGAIESGGSIRTLDKPDMWGSGGAWGASRQWATSPEVTIRGLMDSGQQDAAKVMEFYRAAKQVDPAVADEFLQEAEELIWSVQDKFFNVSPKTPSPAAQIIYAMFGKRGDQYPLMQVDRSYTTGAEPSSEVLLNPYYFESVEEAERAMIVLAAALNRSEVAWKMTVPKDAVEARRIIGEAHRVYPTITIHNYDLVQKRLRADNKIESYSPAGFNEEFLRDIEAALAGTGAEISGVRHGDAGLQIRFALNDSSRKNLDSVAKKMDNVTKVIRDHGVTADLSITQRPGRGSRIAGDDYGQGLSGRIGGAGAGAASDGPGLGSGSGGTGHPGADGSSFFGGQAGAPVSPGAQSADNSQIRDALEQAVRSVDKRGQKKLRTLLVKGQRIAWDDLNEPLRRMIQDRARQLGLDPQAFIALLFSAGAASQADDLPFLTDELKPIRLD